MPHDNLTVHTIYVNICINTGASYDVFSSNCEKFTGHTIIQLKNLYRFYFLIGWMKLNLLYSRPWYIHLYTILKGRYGEILACQRYLLNSFNHNISLKHVRWAIIKVFLLIALMGLYGLIVGLLCCLAWLFNHQFRSPIRLKFTEFFFFFSEKNSPSSWDSIFLPSTSRVNVVQAPICSPENRVSGGFETNLCNA